MLRPLWRQLLPLAALLLVRAQEEGSSDDDKPKESKTKESSKLAPTVGYTGLHSFLHGGVGSPDKLPKVLLLLGSADADTPEWYTSAAMSFKEGKKKSVSFAVVKADGEKTAHRFGFAKEDELPRAGLLVVCLVDGSGSGTYARYKGSLVMGGGTSVKAVKEFVKGVINESGDEEQQPLPPFPPPDIPRKQASVSLLELSYDNLPTHCFGGPKAICIIALLPCAAAPTHQHALAAHLRRARAGDAASARSPAPSPSPRPFALARLPRAGSTPAPHTPWRQGGGSQVPRGCGRAGQAPSQRPGAVRVAARCAVLRLEP
jgi:hypothetical protein